MRLIIFSFFRVLKKKYANDILKSFKLTWLGWNFKFFFWINMRNEKRRNVYDFTMGLRTCCTYLQSFRVILTPKIEFFQDFSSSSSFLRAFLPQKKSKKYIFFTEVTRWRRRRTTTEEFVSFSGKHLHLESRWEVGFLRKNHTQKCAHKQRQFPWAWRETTTTLSEKINKRRRNSVSLFNFVEMERKKCHKNIFLL